MADDEYWLGSGYGCPGRRPRVRDGSTHRRRSADEQASSGGHRGRGAGEPSTPPDAVRRLGANGLRRALDMQHARRLVAALGVTRQTQCVTVLACEAERAGLDELPVVGPKPLVEELLGKEIGSSERAMLRQCGEAQRIRGVDAAEDGRSPRQRWPRVRGAGARDDQGGGCSEVAVTRVSDQGGHVRCDPRDWSPGAAVPVTSTLDERE